MPGKEIILASNNPGKLKEMASILSELSLDIRSQSDFNVPDVEETGLSFVENALIKARNACEHTNLPAIADDSGIEVDCLNGEPGIYSARYAGPAASDEANLQLLLDNVKDKAIEKPVARYQCVIVYLRHVNDPTPIIAHGTWPGYLVYEPTGSNGFGYDPAFYVPDHHCTSAELEPSVKNRISHRGQALLDLMSQMKNTPLLETI
jgi:XTP/dITP diphosphohydrolase